MRAWGPGSRRLLALQPQALAARRKCAGGSAAACAGAGQAREQQQGLTLEVVHVVSPLPRLSVLLALNDVGRICGQAADRGKFGEEAEQACGWLL